MLSFELFGLDYLCSFLQVLVFSAAGGVLSSHTGPKGSSLRGHFTRLELLHVFLNLSHQLIFVNDEIFDERRH